MKTVEIPEVLTDPQRPGILTTEFWLTLLGALLLFFTQVHVLTPDASNFFLAQLAVAVPLLFKLAGICVLVARYVEARLHLKTTPPDTPPMQYLAVTPEEESVMRAVLDKTKAVATGRSDKVSV